MSASLVGSEMCIRDRCTTDALRGELDAHAPQGLGRGEAERARAARCGPCLLYTSDAADDM
eukprot:3928997-Alexandrium_andersonii.AAC.1